MGRGASGGAIRGARSPSAIPRARPTWRPRGRPRSRWWRRATRSTKTRRPWWSGRGGAGTGRPAPARSAALAADHRLAAVAEGRAQDLEDVGVQTLHLQRLEQVVVDGRVAVLELFLLERLDERVELPIAERAAQTVVADVVEPHHRPDRVGPAPGAVKDRGGRCYPSPEEDVMPNITIQWYAGRTLDQKRELTRAITDAIVKIAKTSPDQVHIVFEDVEKTHWGWNGKLASE